jgi:hypothetical protein
MKTVNRDGFPHISNVGGVLSVASGLLSLCKNYYKIRYYTT